MSRVKMNTYALPCIECGNTTVQPVYHLTHDCDEDGEVLCLNCADKILTAFKHYTPCSTCDKYNLLTNRCKEGHHPALVLCNYWRNEEEGY